MWNIQKLVDYYYVDYWFASIADFWQRDNYVSHFVPLLAPLFTLRWRKSASFPRKQIKKIGIGTVAQVNRRSRKQAEYVVPYRAISALQTRAGGFYIRKVHKLSKAS